MTQISLDDLSNAWFGLTGGVESDSRRVLMVGAGLTKALNDAAPLFDHFRSAVEDSIGQHNSAIGLSSSDRDNITDLIDLLATIADRQAVVRALLSEPNVNAPGIVLSPQMYFLNESPAPPGFDSTMRPFRQWREIVESNPPLHLDILQPNSDLIVLGRLLREGVADTVMSTNWDAYVELAFWLTGGDVEFAGQPQLRDGSGTLQVYDTAHDAMTYPPEGNSIRLLKIHGGVDAMAALFDPRRPVSYEQREKGLKDSLMVTSTDMTHWHGSAQWINDAVNDAMRSSRTLALGVSGGDNVTFRAYRGFAKRWAEAVSDPSTGSRVEDIPPFSALQYSKNSRNVVMTAYEDVGEKRYGAAYSQDQMGYIASLYGVRFVRESQARINRWYRSGKSFWGINASPAQDLSDALFALLWQELTHDIANPGSTIGTGESATISELIAYCIGPSLRFAAASAVKAPFGPAPPGVADKSQRLLWLYRSWFGMSDEHTVATPALLKACLFVLLMKRLQAKVPDRRTGLIELSQSVASSNSSADLLTFQLRSLQALVPVSLTWEQNDFEEELGADSGLVRSLFDALISNSSYAYGPLTYVLIDGVDKQTPSVQQFSRRRINLGIESADELRIQWEELFTHQWLRA